MPAHIFVLDEGNYAICTHRGIVGLPEAVSGSKNELATNDALLSRMAIVKEGDYILFYVTGVKELRGIWKAAGKPFYDDTPVWSDKTYPFRYRLESTQYSFAKPLRLNDIFDLRNSGKIWTFALKRASGTNAMFSISDLEFDILLQEYLKINPFTMSKNIIMEPYPVKPANLFEKIHKMDGGHLPRYEASLMALLLGAFVKGEFQDIFGNYSDYLSYVPTNLGTEIDILLFFGNPQNKQQTMSYDIIEVKLDRFDAKALRQLIGYEAWFIHKKVQGDMNMVRVSAIAKRFDADVVDYVQKRKQFEGKEIKLFQYDIAQNGELMLSLM
ncbi:MAG: hypothetical protein ABFC84_09720 [Veillonellales bacterium]